MLEDREDGHNGPGSARAMLVNEDQKGRKKRGRGRKRAEAELPAAR